MAEAERLDEDQRVAEFVRIVAGLVATMMTGRRPRGELFVAGFVHGLQLGLDNQRVASRYLLALRKAYGLRRTRFTAEMATALERLGQGQDCPR